MKKPYIDLGIKWGLIMALIICALKILLFYTNLNLYGSSITSYVPIAIMLAGMVMLGIQARSIKGSLSYSDAFLALFMSVLISRALISVVDYAVISTASAAKLEDLKKIALERTEEIMERWGAPEEKIDEALARIEENGVMPSFTQVILGLLWYLAAYTVLALIVAAIVKKKPPYDTFIATNPDETASYK